MRTEAAGEMCCGMANAHHRISVDRLHTSLRSPECLPLFCFFLVISNFIFTHA